MSVREGISDSKILNSFLILDWSNRLKLVQNNTSDNIVDDYSLWISEMNESNDTRKGREKIRIFFITRCLY